MTQPTQAEIPSFEKNELSSYNMESALDALQSAENVEQTFFLLHQWSLSTNALQASAYEVEQQLFLGGMELLRRMLEQSFASRGKGDVALALFEQQEGGEVRLGQRNEHTRQYESRFGTIQILRQGYKGAQTSSIHPLDEGLNLPKKKYSYVLQEQAMKLCSRGPYEEARENIKETTAANFPKRQLEEVAIETAQDFDVFYEQRQRKAQVAEQTGSILVAGIDRTGVPKRKSEEEKQEDAEKKGQRLKAGEKRTKKKMAMVASVHTTQPFVRTPEQVVSRLMDKHTLPVKQKRPEAEERRLWASLLNSKDEMIQDVVEEMKRRDPAGEKTVTCLMDGERALRTGAEKYILEAFPGLILILDLIHVIEYLWLAVYAFFAVGSQEAYEWVRAKLLLILRGGVSRVVAGMKQSATKQGLSKKKRKAVDKACKYFMKNKDRMRYNEYLEQGLPIASGSVEGACGHLVKDRMARTGASWDINAPGAEAILRLRALDKSGDFADYWQFHMRQEKDRNYKRSWRPEY